MLWGPWNKQQKQKVKTSTLQVPIVININFLPMISIHCQEIRSWELIKWSPHRKCLDLLSNSLNLSFTKMYRDQFGEFVCEYWGFNKGLIKGQKAGTCLGLQGSYSFLDLKFKTFSKQYFIFPDARLTNRCSISRPWKTQETSFCHDALQMYGNQGAMWTYNERELWNLWNFSFCD